MTFAEFDIFQAALLKEVITMGSTKGKEYANSTDRFANFNRLAPQLGITNIQVAWVYVTKHLDSIAQYCHTQKTYSGENIRGRLIDAITYLTLIAGMIEETSSIKMQLVASNIDNTKCSICDKTFETNEAVITLSSGVVAHANCK